MSMTNVQNVKNTFIEMDLSREERCREGNNNEAERRDNTERETTGVNSMVTGNSCVEERKKCEIKRDAV